MNTAGISRTMSLKVKSKVSTPFSDLRFRTQGKPRSDFMRDANKKNIPEGFPEGVLLVLEIYKEELGEPKYILHPDYRRKGKEAFNYFATRILTCVNARYTDYKSKCQVKLLSKAFAASDEAYALALLINEYESYQFKLRKDKDEGDAKPRKPFTNSMSGNMLGWNLRGQETYVSILEEMRQRRKEHISKTLEEDLLQGFKKDGVELSSKRKRR